MITTNLEYWDATKDTPKPFYPGGPGIVGGDLPGNVYDNPNWTWREYGQRVGVWRMFEIFDQFGVPSTCTMNAKMGLERRAVIDAALKRGWEIVAHNYVQTELLADYSFDENKEREVIRETLRVYKEVCGKPAKGWLSSSLRCTLNTVDIIAEEGLIFTTDLLNDDQPYLVETRSGKKIVSIPYTSEVNDFTVFMRQGQDVDGGVQGVQGAVRLALPRERDDRPHDEHRLASACHRPAVPHPRAARFPRLRQRRSTTSGSPPARKSPSGT